MNVPLKKPDWLRFRAPGGEQWKKVNEILSRRELQTVCDEARCPNKGECWGMGTATFMILGDICTRHCRFCAVKSAKTGCIVREAEAKNLALAIKELALDYAVLTSVDRDDLEDRGAGHFALCIGEIKKDNPLCKVEVLIPDYCGEELSELIRSAPDLIAHNVETVRSLQGVIRDKRASFDKSLRTLREAKINGIITKSSILLGLGEKEEEVLSAMDELRSVGVDILVLGQYLQPSKNQIPVSEYIAPETFEQLGNKALNRGFSSVVSSPKARTSYQASLLAAACTCA
jgi:lipoic acid synthetase